MGTVTAVNPQKADSSGRYVLCMPSADFQHIEEVLILRTVVETDDDGLAPVPTATPVPTPVVTPQPSDALAQRLGGDGRRIPPGLRPRPPASATQQPLYDELPEDIWAAG